MSMPEGWRKLNIPGTDRGWSYDPFADPVEKLIFDASSKDGLSFSANPDAALRAKLSGQDEKEILSTLKAQNKDGWAEPIYAGRKQRYSPETQERWEQTSWIPYPKGDEEQGGEAYVANYAYKDKDGNIRLFNPPGMDMGDVASLGKYAAEGAGAMALASPPGRAMKGLLVGKNLPKAVKGLLNIGARGAGAGVGGAAGEAAYETGARAAGMEDQRSVPELLKGAGGTALDYGLGEIGGAGATKALGLLGGKIKGALKGRGGAWEDVTGVQPPSMAAATQSPPVSSVERSLMSIPGSGGVRRRVEQGTTEALEGALAPGGKQGKRSLGQQAESLLLGDAPYEGASPIGGRAQAAKVPRVKAYKEFDEMFPGNSPVDLNNTEKAMRKMLSSNDDPTRAVAKKLIRSIEDTRKTGAPMTFDDIIELRQIYGEGAGQGELAKSLSKEAKAKIYSILTKDAEEAIARDAGQAGLASWRRAKGLYRAEKATEKDIIKRATNAKTPDELYDVLDGFVNKNNETAVKTLIGEMPTGKAKNEFVKDFLSRKGWDGSKFNYKKWYKEIDNMDEGVLDAMIPRNTKGRANFDSAKSLVKDLTSAESEKKLEQWLVLTSSMSAAGGLAGYTSEMPGGAIAGAAIPILAVMGGGRAASQFLGSPRAVSLVRKAMGIGETKAPQEVITFISREANRARKEMERGELTPEEFAAIEEFANNSYQLYNQVTPKAQTGKGLIASH